MLKEQNVKVALAVNGDRTTIMVRRSDDGAGPSWMRWDLGEVEKEGHHALCQRVGSAVVAMLAQMYPDEFASFPGLAPPDLTSLDELRDLVLGLIRRSVEEKTTVYVAAIDNLFERHAAELGQTDLPETWRSIRIRVMTRPAPT
jgi:hypothetical protein